MKRVERTGIIIKILTENSNKLYSLNYFTELFQAAKSTVSEDISIAKSTLYSMGHGRIETVSGAAGGVKYLPMASKELIKDLQDEICNRLEDETRILAGGFVFTSDIMFDPCIAKKAGKIFASKFMDRNADCVVTIESKGIPLAAMTADALHLPLVVIRRESKVSEGSTMSINYVSGSTDRIQKMSVSKRMLKNCRKVIIIDDFMKAGGSARGMVEMMREFDIEVVGIGVLISTSQPEKKKVSDYFPLLYMDQTDEEAKIIRIIPNYQV